MNDERFIRGEKVPMTKEAVRAAALSKLALHDARHLIDIGAGTGSVSIEAALAHPQLQVTAIERNPAALGLLEENCQRFACRNITLVPGVAPLFIGQPADAVFMGGSGGNLTKLIDWSLAQLNPGGRLVMTFILQENLSTALAHLVDCPVTALDCQQLQVSQLTPLGSGHYFKAHNPVFLISCEKEQHHG
ncbi:decarboxylating cobalt-precorrin-6B (C(15))-methyltransferase [Kosakonia sacchari]|uniref:Cobalt-precorrin-6B (C15)-methyltransferase n=1 Tax=Kosakonia sacchari TaxID=1158459 RepID=A0A1G4YG13_9ENTR|nr:decarboxylating cobalt-precorrin-6B (C(15))-methyltransferase [Kosakonia sacchari]AHJ73363.1 precorrin-6Y C5,15-methyltransferase (decarboxylating) subunit CbiT [Kosakonia sacchari SP1]NUL38684.1 decarboxylating cobalt-precorrin-6B (C(15))-methyltransferase [Kosakonia sacchari]SCX52314.1 cobalt-precorrin-6B (C15)-methyltransferase [Kosakonia sacchari]